MNHLVVLLLLTLSFQSLNGQTPLSGLLIDSLEKAKNLTESEKNENANLRRQRTSNASFLRLTLNHSALSYASPPYCDFGSPKSPYILSADIIPHFIIGGEWMRFPIHITTRFKARILRENFEDGDSSLPVRTPSYMPGATIYAPLHNMTENTTKVKYMSLSFFHHSNGQDGREFDSAGKINLYNGNFSTNYFELAYHFRKRINPTAGYGELYGRIGYEHHLWTALALKKTYGDHRINLLFGYIKVDSYTDEINGIPETEPYLRERYRLVSTATFIASERRHDLSSIEKRINIDLNYHWRIRSSPNAALFIGAGYYGSDPYNIYYEQSYFFAHAGISLGFFVAPKMIGLKK